VQGDYGGIRLTYNPYDLSALVLSFRCGLMALRMPTCMRRSLWWIAAPYSETCSLALTTSTSTS
jgi:hypothetical protein